jgi:peptide/nickel transport system substrate-binding protein
MTAEDVLWSLDRPSNIVNSPDKMDVFTKEIVSKRAVDRYTMQITTAGPYPLMPVDLVAILIVSKKAAQGQSSDDFNQGRGMTGTGPFKFVSYQRDDRIELARNIDYWSEKPAWDKVTIRFIPDNATRMAALIAGDSLRDSRIVGVHVLKNIMIPVVTVVALQFGSIEEGEAQRQALDIVSRPRYAKDGYFAVINSAPRMIMHPIKPSLAKETIAGALDANGVKVFEVQVAAGKGNTELA